MTLFTRFRLRNIPVMLAFMCIVLIAVILRFWHLGVIPNGLTNDEADYIYNAYSIWHTQHDLTGAFLPLSINLDNSFSPVPIYLVAPFVGIMGLSPFSGRFIFALLGVGTVLSVYFIVKLLFKNECIALASMFVIAVSPWHIHFSRIAYDGGIALFFYICGLYVFLKGVHTKKYLWSIPFFLLGFYSYHGTKIFFIFFIILLVYIYREYLLKKKKVFFLFAVSILGIIASFILITKFQHVDRSKVFLWNDSVNASKLVNLERTYNTAPFYLREIYNNKFMVYMRTIRENYLEAFSPQFLFLYGETSGLAMIYGTSFRGMLYIIELPLLVLGILFLSKVSNKMLRNFLLVFLLIAPLPSTFTIDKTYAMRSIMMIPILSICIGCGIFFLYTKTRNSIQNNSVFTFACILFCSFYLFLISSYLYQYYFRYAVYGAEAFNKSSRDLVEYIGKNRKNYNNVIVADPGNLIIQYVIFNAIDPVTAAHAYRSPLPKIITNVAFVSGCIDTHGLPFDPKVYLPKKTLYIAPASCHSMPVRSPRFIIADAGEPERHLWQIFDN